jgi:hypothetical protein
MTDIRTVVNAKKYNRWYHIVGVCAACILFVIYFVFSPNKILLKTVSSPDGRLSVVVTEYISSVSMATPFREISIRHNSFGYISPFFSILLKLDVANENDDIKIKWNNQTHLEIYLPESSICLTRSATSFKADGIKYYGASIRKSPALKYANSGR